jgi:sec-independent protein translocase protein TatA
MFFLFLNDISTGEVLIILVFILMFFGSKSIPNMARTFGRTLRQIRDATDDIKRDIRNSTSEIEKEITNARDNLSENAKSVSDSFNQQTKNLEDISKKFKSTLDQTDKETISNKRRPITQKFVDEEELISLDDDENEPTNSKNEKHVKKDQTGQKILTDKDPNTDNDKEIVQDENIADTNEATVPPDSKNSELKSDNKPKEDKAPET